MGSHPRSLLPVTPGGATLLDLLIFAAAEKSNVATNFLQRFAS
jgi:hypothetical protein